MPDMPKPLDFATLRRFFKVPDRAGDTSVLKFEYVNALEIPPKLRSMSVAIMGPRETVEERATLTAQIKRQEDHGIWVEESDGSVWLKPKPV
jgi:hypothetical protein